MTDSNSPESFVLFELAGHTCGVRSHAVQSVEIVEHIAAVPNALPFVEGIAFTRGQVIPGINLRVRLGFPRIPRDARARMLVVRCGNRTAGMLVDQSREFISIAPEAIQHPGETIAGFGRYVEGIARFGNRSILIVNIEEVIEGT